MLDMDQKRSHLFISLVLVFVLLASFAGLWVVTRSPRSASIPTTPTAAPPQAIVAEQPVIRIPLTGPVAHPNAEVSGLAWYGEHLILLPQYPSRLDDALFALAKSDILAYLDGAGAQPLEPQPISFDDAGISSQIDQFQGYEAIAFAGERVYLTIESGRGADMLGYLVSGSIAQDLNALHLDAIPRPPIAPQTTLDNATDESLIVMDDLIFTLYEENGASVNDAPVAQRFDVVLTSLDTIPFPQIEYRITDAAEMDTDRRFWAINYFFPGDKAQAPEDPLVAMYGQGKTHSQHAWVERLVMFHYAESGITLVDQVPIYLELSDEARNWEGLVKLDTRGFLLITDKFPETILGFVKHPNP